MKGKSVKIYSKKELWNFRELVRYIDSEYGNKVAFKYRVNGDDIKSVLYSEFCDDIKKMGTYLISKLGQRKKVAIISKNRYEWCVSYFAITTSNMIAVPLDKSLPKNELEGLIERSGVQCIIFSKDYIDVIEDIKKKDKTSLKNFICMDDLQGEFVSYSDTINYGDQLILKGDKSYDNVVINNKELSIILFTSGTTALAKGVMLSQYNICSNVNAMKNVVNVDTNDTFLSFLPLHHTFESSTTFLFGISGGITIVFCDGLKYIGKNLQEFNITGFVCVPLMLESMYKKVYKGIKDSNKEFVFKVMRIVARGLLKIGIDVRRKLFKSILDKIGGNLRVIISGAAGIDREVAQGFADLGIKVLQGYGLTETAPVLCAENDKYSRIGTIGVPLYNVEFKIENPDKDGVGEIVAKGPNIMMGYYENEEATKEVMKGGWFHTGDLAYIDKDGYCHITGRKKTVIVMKNGKNIYPEELETIVNGLDFVEESMIFGKTGKDNEVDLACKIVYKPDVIDEVKGELSVRDYIWEEIKKINKSFPPYKYIRDIIVTDEELIKTTTKKIKRYEEMKKMGIQ